jgi:hypothetical protein
MGCCIGQQAVLILVLLAPALYWYAGFQFSTPRLRLAYGLPPFVMFCQLLDQPAALSARVQ